MDYYFDQGMIQPDNVDEQTSSSNKSVSPQKHSLGKEFFLSMARLENFMLTSKETSFTIIDELITMYTQCVEVYDSKSDPIKAYFLEKIQQTFSLDKTIKNLLDSPKIKTFTFDAPKSVAGPISIQPVIQKRQTHHKINVAMTIKETQQQNKNQLNEMIEGYCSSANLQDRLIHGQLYDQQTTIENRQKRRQSSIMNPENLNIGRHAKNNQSFDFNNLDDFNKSLNNNEINVDNRTIVRKEDQSKNSSGMMDYLKRTLMNSK